jgi:hypothetical protein
MNCHCNRACLERQPRTNEGSNLFAKPFQAPEVTFSPLRGSSQWQIGKPNESVNALMGLIFQPG